MTTDAYQASDRITLDLHDLYENAPCGYHSVDSDGTILRMNRTELMWLGFTRQELARKKRFAELVAPRHHRAYEGALEGVLAGHGAAEIEIELVRKDDTVFDAFLRIARVREEGSDFVHTRATVIDITSRKRAENAARRHAEQLQAISRRVVEIQETERRKLSAELHDRVGQDLAAINLNLHLIRDQLPATCIARVGIRLDDSIALVERTLDGVRDVAGALRPLVLDDYGLVAALKSYGEQFAGRTGIRVGIAEPAAVPRLRPNLEMTLFRVAQEALTNVLKHAGASAVRMTLECEPPFVLLTIVDDGRGFATESGTERRSAGLGLLIMDERLRAVGGSLRIASRPGAGTSVAASVRSTQ